VAQTDEDVRLVISGSVGELRGKIQQLYDEFVTGGAGAADDGGTLKEALSERVGQKAARFETIHDYLQQAYATTKELTKEDPEGRSRSYILKEAGLDGKLDTDDMQSLLQVLSLAGLVERNQRKWRTT